MNLHALLECALWRLLLAMNLQAQLKLAQEKKVAVTVKDVASCQKVKAGSFLFCD